MKEFISDSDNRVTKFYFDRKFARRILDLTWSELKATVKAGWVDVGAAVELAEQRVRQGDDSEQVLHLATFNYTQDRADVVEVLEELALEGPCSINKEKWATLAVVWVYENRHQFTNPLELVDGVYADFDYPDSIVGIVGYMPSPGAPKDMMAELSNFVENQCYDKVIATPGGCE